MASLAQFESALISQRVRADMARAKAQGKYVAPPALTEVKQAQIHKLFAEGVLMNQISKRIGLACGTMSLFKVCFYG